MSDCTWEARSEYSKLRNNKLKTLWAIRVQRKCFDLPQEINIYLLALLFGCRQVIRAAWMHFGDPYVPPESKLIVMSLYFPFHYWSVTPASLQSSNRGSKKMLFRAKLLFLASKVLWLCIVHLVSASEPGKTLTRTASISLATIIITWMN